MNRTKNAQSKMEFGYVEKTDTEKPLRLRGGCDDETGSKDVEMVAGTSKNTGVSNSGDMVNTGKRGATSPGGTPAKKAPGELGNRYSNLFGWLEHTIQLERGENLTVGSSEGMMERITEL